DGHVTGVQTCALPILGWRLLAVSWRALAVSEPYTRLHKQHRRDAARFANIAAGTRRGTTQCSAQPRNLSSKTGIVRSGASRGTRSEERRVGKEGRTRW